MPMQKAYFLSHGSPTLVLDDVPAHHFLRSLGDEIVRPDAILMVSAHWETQIPTVNSVEKNATIHDFGGFPQQLFEMQYPAAGSPETAIEVSELLAKGGFEVQIDNYRGLDHGAWVPLELMYPNADIPVLQLSIQSHLSPKHHFEIGKAIASLRDRNIAIIASGSFTHNLREIKWDGGEEEIWSKDFSAWFHNALQNKAIDDLLNYRALAPYAVKNHPTDEHLLPIFVAMGAAGEGFVVDRLHSSATFGSLRMDAYSFS
jgi:4,5-DOPA dioxygenase extradiol